MTEWISWFATAATVTAALITASNLGARITGYGFVVFLFGSVAWFAIGLLTDQSALMWTNAILTGLNIFGIWRWLGRQTKMEEGAEAAEEGSRSTPGESLFPASLLTHAAVLDPQGEEIARGVDAMIGSRTGRIHYLVASAGGVAGVGERLHRVDWRQARVDEGRLRLAITRSAFYRLPTVPREHWPSR
ncbi:MAG TPA: PRC-barrel domain-containing protein [Sphingomicrobium sp.]